MGLFEVSIDKNFFKVLVITARFQLQFLKLFIILTNSYFYTRAMLKKPGAFSQKYTSNTLSNRPSHKNDRLFNKENKNLNGTFEQNEDSDFAIYLRPKVTPPKTQPQQRTNNSTLHKIRQQYQKKEKQLSLQITKLKKQTSKLRQDNKLLQTNNQDTICKYEQIMKEFSAEKQDLLEEIEAHKDKNLQYRDYLQYSVLWLIQIFSMGVDQHKKGALDKYMSKDKFAQLFQKLNPIVQELEIQQQLKRLCSKNSRQSSIQDYLLLENNDFSIESSINADNVQPELPTLLDTFDFRKTYEENERQESQQVKRKLFQSPDDSLQIQDKNNKCNIKKVIGCQQLPLQMNKKKDKSKEFQPDQCIIIGSEYIPSQEDYLRLPKNTQVKLLRKVGDELWIVEVGDQIGYIEAYCLNQ